MPTLPSSSDVPSVPLSKGQLGIARLIWVFLLLLTIGKLSLGLPLYYAETNRVCTAPEEICSQGTALMPHQVEALQEAGLTLPSFARIDLAWKIVTSVIWGGVGLFIFLLRPNERLAWIASAMMIVFNSAGYETQIRSAYPSLGAAADLIFSLGNILLFLFIGLFPTGSFSPRWMRWYWLTLIMGVTLNPLLDQNPEIGNIVIAIFWVSFLILGPYSQIYRYRNESTAVQRQQTKWVVLGFAVFAATVLIGFVLLTLRPEIDLGPIIYQTFVFDLVGLLIPLSIGISILRYRLWDIDIIICRTLQYSLLTGLLGLVYFGSVVLLQRLLGQTAGERSTLVLVLSTLLIAALFTPLRRRIQNLIDRRFYRQKYAAAQVLADFARTARDETDIHQLTTCLVEVVHETLQPQQITLWLKENPKPEWYEVKSEYQRAS